MATLCLREVSGDCHDNQSSARVSRSQLRAQRQPRLVRRLRPLWWSHQRWLPRHRPPADYQHRDRRKLQSPDLTEVPFLNEVVCLIQQLMYIAFILHLRVSIWFFFGWLKHELAVGWFGQCKAKYYLCSTYTCPGHPWGRPSVHVP